MKNTQNRKQSAQLKASVIALAVFGAVAGQANAQTITPYGRVVAGVDYQSNVATGPNSSGSQVKLAANQWGTSFVGIIGDTDIGGGVKASLVLETGMHTDNGAGNGTAIFNRKAYVGIGSATAGTLNFGEDLTIACGSWDIDPMGHEFMGVESLNHGRSWGGGVVNNIEYTSPNLGGLTLFAQLGLGGKAGDTAANRTEGVRATYVQPNFLLRAQYDDRRDADGKFSDLFSSSKVSTLGGTVTLDKLKVFGGVQHFASDQVGTNAADQTWVGVNYQASGPLLVRAALYHIKINNDVGSASLFTAGVDYALFKNILAYAAVGTVRNGAHTNISVEGGEGGSPLFGKSQLGAYAGLSYSF